MDFLTKFIAFTTAIIAMATQLIVMSGRANDKSADKTATAERATSAFSQFSSEQKIRFILSSISGLVLFPAALGLLMYWAARGSTEPLSFRSASFLIAIGVTAVVASRTPKL